MKGFILPVILFGIFGSIAVLLILFAQGKRITLDGQIISTGILRIDIVPDDTEIFVNGEEVSLSGNRLDGIEIGELAIEIRKEDFSTWRKNVVVDGSFVKRIHAQVYPNNPIITRINSYEIDRFFPSNDLELFVGTEFNEEDDELLVYTLDHSSSLNPLQGLQTEFELSKTITNYSQICSEENNNGHFIKISENDDKFIIECDLGVQIHDLDNEKIVVDISKNLGFIPRNINWFDSSRSVIIDEGDLVFEYNLATGAKTLILYSPETGVPRDLKEDALLFIDRGELKIYKDGKQRVVTQVELEEITKLDIFLLNEDKQEFFYITDEFAEFIGLEEEFNLRLDGNYDVLRLAGSGEELLLLEKTSNKYYSFVFQDTIREIKYLTEFNELEGDSYLRFSLSGDVLISLKSREIAEVAKNDYIVLSDNDGENSHVIYAATDGFEIKEAWINEDNTRLYINLSDLNNAEESLLLLDLEENEEV